MVDIGYDGDELRESRIQALKTSSPAAFLNWRGWTRPKSGPACARQRQPARRCWARRLPQPVDEPRPVASALLAAGSAVVLGALIDNQMPDISLEGLTWKQTA